MISRFFIDRPIFASVLSIVITLAGAISLFHLPIAQFPTITPPTIQVTCNYPGASALDVSTSVAAPIEEQVDGVEGMYYMSSNSTNDGSYTLTVTFRHGIDLNMAQVLVQNRVNLALPSLPDVIRQTGVTVKKQSPDILVGLAITTTDEQRYDQLYLSNFALMQIRDELSRLDGISDVKLFGERDYSMRIWVDPNKLAARNLSAGDVVRAIHEQNQQVATGMIGAPPVQSKQDFEITMSTLGRLSDVEQFENIIIKTDGRGDNVRIKDIGRVQLGSKNEDVDVKLDGKPTVFLAIFQLPDANALETYDQVISKMHDLERSFPEGVKWEVAFDTTPYTRESINEVFKTLRDAVALVAVVVLIFLRNWRSSLIPMVAVPVAIIGTFVAMAALGFSLNNLTLFGLVLAIGIVVDDAIVVVEAVEHHIETGLPPREATIKAMDQVSGPVIAVGLVLSAVFVPCAFISGITGQFFRQFALTISVSTVISAFNSLTLSPALAALLLKPIDKKRKHTTPPLPWPAFVIAGGWAGWEYLTPHLSGWLQSHGVGPEMMPYIAAALGAVGGGIVSWPLNRLLALLFAGFNLFFNGLSIGYTWIVGLMLYVTPVVLLLYGGLLYLTYQDLEHTPKGFIPGQDMGYLLCNVQLPDSASMERSEKVMAQLSDIAQHTPGVKHASAITGMSFVLSAFGSNFGSVFIGLQDYSERRDPSLSSDRIIASLTQQFAAKIYDAQVMVFPPPPVRGVGRAGGFMLMVEDRGDLGPNKLQEQTENLVAAASQQNPGKIMVFPSPFRANVPQLKIEPDIHECMEKGVTLRDFADTLQIYQGSLYVNDFNLFGRTWEVIVQAEPQFRDRIEDLPRLEVRSHSGDMVPLGSLASIQQVNGPLLISRYNSYPSAPVNGTGLPGVSSADAIEMMAKTAKDVLPPSMTFEWTDMAYLELLAGNTAMVIFGLAVVMVFLVLAAQYESWSLPMAVILVVPMCLLSAIVGVRMAAMDINIFTRIGFVVLVGLASKNAILIVEFAKHRREEGESRRQATLEACHLRLRPIIMTSLAFILGVLPLMLATGAGAEMRRTLGTAVFSGMLGVTVFGIFLTPVFFSTIDWLGGTPLFASWLARFVGRWSINIVSLRPVREYAHRVRVRRAAKPVVRRSSADTVVANTTAVVASNGNGLANTHVDAAEIPKPVSEPSITDSLVLNRKRGISPAVERRTELLNPEP
ncbi:MAG TPA: multidrug efflux RND transporter permease subunit [Pirellulales bacterium]|nr:multidrug efflux RND transporter permease subunit [Pirellulales bacterium]